MKPAFLHWFARRAHGFVVVGLVLLALIMALVTPLALLGCSAPPSRPHSMTQPRLEAQTTFVAGALQVRVTLEPFSLAAPARGDESADGRGGGGGGRPPPPGAGGPAEMDESGATARFSAGAIPRIQLRVAVTNTSRETLGFAITDVVSALGNFAVRPERLSLAPGQSAQIDPFCSAFPEALTALTVEVRLRHAGQTETHTLQLAPATGAAAPR